MKQEFWPAPRALCCSALSWLRQSAPWGTRDDGCGVACCPRPLSLPACPDPTLLQWSFLTIVLLKLLSTARLQFVNLGFMALLLHHLGVFLQGKEQTLCAFLFIFLAQTWLERARAVPNSRILGHLKVDGTPANWSPR